MISGTNHLHESSVRCVPLTVNDLVIDSVLVHIRELHKHLSDEEKRVIGDFVKSERPVTLITTKFSAQQQSQLIDELLREGSFTSNRIPQYLRVTLSGISASQKFYSSLWPSKASSVRPSSPHKTPIARHHKSTKVSVYRPQDRFDNRPRRPGGVHVGQRKPLDFKVYNDGLQTSVFHTIHDYMRSILPNVF